MQKCGERSGLQVCGEPLNFEGSKRFKVWTIIHLLILLLSSNDGVGRLLGLGLVVADHPPSLFEFCQFSFFYSYSFSKFNFRIKMPLSVSSIRTSDGSLRPCLRAMSIGMTSVVPAGPLLKVLVIFLLSCTNECKYNYSLKVYRFFSINML